MRIWRSMTRCIQPEIVKYAWRKWFAQHGLRSSSGRDREIPPCERSSERVAETPLIGEDALLWPKSPNVPNL